MCLGDIRFLPLIRSRAFNVDVTTAYTELVPRNQVRVGLFIPSVNNNVGRANPIVAPGDSLQGFAFSNDAEVGPGLIVTWKDWGDLVQHSWFLTLTTATTIVVFEAVVPAEVMQEIRRMGLHSEFALKVS